MIQTYFQNQSKTFGLSMGDCIEIMSEIAVSAFQFDMVFADPPYFLSNGGISVQSGKQVCVNKGEWDKSHGADIASSLSNSNGCDTGAGMGPGPIYWQLDNRYCLHIVESAFPGNRPGKGIP